MSVIKSKRRRPASLGYNSWVSYQFDYNTGIGSAVIGPIPLALNTKIQAIAYYVPATGFTAGKAAFNMVSGPGAYEGTGASSSYGYFTLGGTFLAGDKITVTVAGVAYTETVNARNVGSLQKIAAALTSFLNNNVTFKTLYRANSLGGQVVVQTLAYSTATPAFTVTVTSVAGTVAVSGANMVAGVAGAKPTQPPLDNPIVTPSAVASPLNTLFPVDIILPLFTSGQAGQSGVIYCMENNEAIFPAASTLLPVMIQTSAYGNIAGSIHGVPVDIHPMTPEELNTGFRLSQSIL